MDVAVGFKRYQPDQFNLAHHKHIDTPQDNNNSIHQLQGYKHTKIKHGKPPRAAPLEVPLGTQGEINHMVSTIPITTHNMSTQVEYKPLPWYLVNSVVDLDTGMILQNKYLIQIQVVHRR